MNTNDDWDDLALFLEDYLNGKISRSEFLGRWEGIETSSSTRTILFNINHLLADEDIRMSDENYRNMQEAEARKLIRALRGRVDFRLIKEISFLKTTAVM